MEGGERVGEPPFPVLVGGAGADGLLDQAGRAGAVADGADLLLVALVGVVPALDQLELVLAGLAADGVAVGRFPAGGGRMRAGVGVAAVHGAQAVQDQRPPVGRRQPLGFLLVVRPAVLIEGGVHRGSHVDGELRAADPGRDGRDAGRDGGVHRVGQGAVPQRDSIPARAAAKTGPGMGMIQPARWASTDSSVACRSSSAG